MEQKRTEIPNSEAALLQQALVELLKNEGRILTRQVEEAFLNVPRHLFLPGVTLETAYSNAPVYTRKKGQEGRVQSCSSPPLIMATMLEMLDVRPGMRILEIGTGTGYNAALLAHMVGPEGQVVTIDIDEDIIVEARANLQTAGMELVQVIQADGAQGYAPAAPYDRIVLTVGVPDIAHAWFEQLSPDGRLIIPIELSPFRSKLTPHLLITFKRVGDALVSLATSIARFVYLRGEFATTPQALTNVGSFSDLTIATLADVDSTQVYATLTASFQSEPLPLCLSPLELRGLSIWLALRDGRFCEMYAEGATPQRALVPPLIDIPGSILSTFGLCEQATLSLLACMDPRAAAVEDQPAELQVCTFGPQTALTQELIDAMLRWDQAGRPFVWTMEGYLENLLTHAYPQSCLPSSTTHDTIHEVVIDKRWTRFICSWR